MGEGGLVWLDGFDRLIGKESLLSAQFGHDLVTMRILFTHATTLASFY
jgi:hypothetical protein